MRRRRSGPDRKTRELVWQRDDGCCVICRRSVHFAPHSFHHRRRRGMGGSRDPLVDSPANLVVLCGSGVTGCHGRVEADPAEATVHGWRVRFGEDPREVPVKHLGRWALLDEFGGLVEGVSPP